MVSSQSLPMWMVDQVVGLIRTTSPLPVLKFLGISTKPDEEVKADRSVIIERKTDVTIIDEVTG